MDLVPIKILLVEDNPHDTELLRETLAEVHDVQFHLTHATRLSEALEVLSKESFDLVLMDLGLPDSRGLDTFLQVRDKASATPIVVLTGLKDETVSVKAVQEGAQDYLVKGNLSGELLVKAVRYAIERKRGEEALRKALDELESRVRERTAELTEANEALQKEILERKQVEVELAQAKQRMENIAQGITDGICLLSRDYKVIWANQGALNLTGCKIEEALGKPCHEVIKGHESPCPSLNIVCPIKEAMKTGSPSISIHTHIDHGGRELILEVSAYPIMDENGEIVQFVHLTRDITERKKMEETLWLTQFSVENAALPIAWIGKDGRLLYANNEISRSLGYSREELLSMTVQDVDPRVTEEIWQKQWDNIKQKGSFSFESAYRSKDGALIPAEVTTNYLAYKDKELQIAFIRNISEQKRAEAKLNKHLDHLAALRAIDMAITASLDLRVTLNVFLDQTTAQLGVDAADILLLDPHASILEYSAGRGFRTEAFKHTQLSLGEGCGGRAAMERRIIQVPDIPVTDCSLRRSPLLTQEGFISYYGVPLISKGQVKGVLEIFHRSYLNPDQDWLDFLEALANQAAIAIDNATLFSDLQTSNIELRQAYDTTLEGWSRALDLRDRETEGHSQRVTELTVRLARTLGLPNNELLHVRRGALLHDIGKMGIPDGILLKPGPLTDEEWGVMRMHPIYAYKLLSPIKFLRQAIYIPYCHHEKWDGSGYPRKLQGEEIPIPARIFAIVDVWDALSSERPYRPAWPMEKVLRYMKEQVGKHFDPLIAETFFTMINS